MKNQQKRYNWLKSLDAFGQPIRFFIDGQSVHKTSGGGVITLIIIIIMISILINSLITLFQRNNSNIEEQILYSKDPPLLNLNKDNFLFFIGMQDPTITLQNSIFSYSFALTTQQNGIKTSIPINLAPCQAQDIQNFVSDNDIQKYLQRTYCPVNFSFPIQGTELSDIFTYIKISVNECISGSNPNITCASPTFIQSYFANTPKVEIVLYFINRVVNPNNIENPLTNFIDSQVWLVSPLGTLARSTDILFRSMQFLSHDDVFDIKSPANYTNSIFLQDRIDNPYIPPSGTQTYVNIYLRSSFYTINYTRTFNTILNVLSFIGGIWNLLYLGLGFIAVMINNHVYQVKMANTLYEFHVKHLNNNNNVKNNKHNKTQSNNQSLEIINLANNNYEVVKDKFDKMKSIRTSLNYSFWELMRNVFRCFRSTLIINKDKLFSNANTKISKAMDIRLILKRMEELQKLKFILLNSSQLGIFHFVPPPLITIKEDNKTNTTNNNDDDDNPTPTKGKNSNNTEDMSNKKLDEQDESLIENNLVDLCQDLNQYYKHVEMYDELKKSQDKINKNLLISLHPAIKNIFECIEENKHNLNMITINIDHDREVKGNISHRLDKSNIVDEHLQNPSYTELSLLHNSNNTNGMNSKKELKGQLDHEQVMPASEGQQNILKNQKGSAS